MMKTFLITILFIPLIYWGQPTGNKQIDGEFTSYFENGSIREKESLSMVLKRMNGNAFIRMAN